MNYKNMFGTAPLTFSKDNHLGTREVFMAQVRNGKWVRLTDFGTYR